MSGFSVRSHWKKSSRSIWCAEFFSFQIIHFIQPAEFIYQDQLFKSFFIQVSRQATADKTCCPCNDNGEDFDHASTIDSISFSIAVSYSCFHSRIFPQFSPSTCMMEPVTYPVLQGNSLHGLFKFGQFFFSDGYHYPALDSPNQYASLRNGFILSWKLKSPVYGEIRFLQGQQIIRLQPHHVQIQSAFLNTGQ